MVFFLSKKRSKSSSRLFGRLGQGLDWSSDLDLESWVRDSSQQSYRLSKGTSCRRSFGSGGQCPSNGLEKEAGL